LTVPRARIEARVAREKDIELIFLESLCDDPAVIAANVALKVTSGDPDYKDTSPEEAKRDFLRRITAYEKVYETITEPHLSYLKIVNVGREVTVSRIHGYLQSRIAFYLMNLHLKPRSIYLSRVRRSAFLCEVGGADLRWFSFSMVKVSLMSRANLVVIRCFRRVGCSMQRLCLR
jgi:6-phosphofructo-2-kinase/fructose-2,6-biphosphatase 2